jgi:hypothetical protein
MTDVKADWASLNVVVRIMDQGPSQDDFLPLAAAEALRATVSDLGHAQFVDDGLSFGGDSHFKTTVLRGRPVVKLPAGVVAAGNVPR